MCIALKRVLHRTACKTEEVWLASFYQEVTARLEQVPFQGTGNLICVEMDSRLEFDNQVQAICAKTCRKLRALSRVGVDNYQLKWATRETRVVFEGRQSNQK